MKKIVIITFLAFIPFLGNAQSVPLPPEIINLQEQYPFLEKVTKPINELQNKVVPVLEKEKTFAAGKKVEYDVTINPADDGVSPLPPIKEKNELKYWMFTIYGWALWLGIWLFTTAIGISILIIFSLYLLIKILIRLFRPRNRIIS